jgi:hypothetical protein
MVPVTMGIHRSAECSFDAVQGAFHIEKEGINHGKNYIWQSCRKNEERKSGAIVESAGCEL